MIIKPILNKRSIFKYFAVIIISIIVLFSCSKTNIDSEDEISKAKNWFETNYSNKAEYDPEFSNVDFDWDKAKVVTYGNNYKPVIVPLKNKVTKSNYVGMSSLIVFPAKNGGYFHRVFTLYPEVDYIKSHKSKLNKNDFTGVASYWDLKKGFVRGVYSKNGQYFSTLKLESNSNINNLPDLSSKKDQTLPMVTVYSNNTGSVGMSQVFNPLGTSSGFFGMGTNSNPGEYSSNNNGCYFIFECLPPEIFENPNYSLVINSISNPCLYNLFNNIQGNLSSLLSPFLGFPNLFITSTLTSPPGVFHNAATSYIDGGNNININLNANLLINSSYEASVETILHETIHAYIMTQANIGEFNSHVTMLYQYSNNMISTMQTINPNLNYTQAAALVYNGLDVSYTGFTQNQITIYNTAKQQLFNTINSHPGVTGITTNSLNFIAGQFRSGVSGTHFPTGGCQ